MTHKPELMTIAVVGGGISGLAAAFYLEKFALAHGHRVAITLYDSGDAAGGKIRTRRHDDFVFELGAESFLSRKPAGVELCRELGVEKELIGTRPEHRKTFIWREGRLFPLPTGLSGFVPGKLSGLIQTPLLSPMGKARAAMDFVLPASRSLEDESLASFISRRLGRQAYARLVQPLLCGIYCGDGDQLSLAATYPEFRKLEQQHGSLIRGLRTRAAEADSNGGKPLPPFVTFRRGMSTLVDAVRTKFRSTQIQSGHRVESVTRANGKWNLQISEQGRETFDKVVLATPSYVSSEMFKDFDDRLSSCLNEIQHVTTATINLCFDKKTLGHELDGYGFVIPSEQQNELTAVTWTSSKHFDRAPGESASIRAYVGRAGAELRVDRDDDELVHSVLGDLKRTMGIEAKPIASVVQKWVQGSPQYTMGHLGRLERIEDALKGYSGIEMCGSSYRGVGIPDCIADGKRAAMRLLDIEK